MHAPSCAQTSGVRTGIRHGSELKLPELQGEASTWIEAIVKDIFAGKHIKA